MKKLAKLSTMMFGLILMLSLTTQQAKAQYDDVSLQTFYDELSPYGTWINDPEYGYVWRPDVDQAEFRPYYTNGRWVMTEYGNTWVSNYDWGWAPFHYGRWMYTRYNRWIWLPDTVWGPAWVSWRSGGGYYGWAPMGPVISVNVNIGPRYVMPDFCWNFIPVGHIYYNSYPHYFAGRNKVYISNTVIINNTYINNNRTYYTGPRADDIRRATNKNVVVYNISRTTNRNSGNSIVNNRVNIYTPRPNRSAENVRPQPKQLVQGNVSRERITNNNSSRVSRNEEGSFSNTRGVRRENGNVDASNVRKSTEVGAQTNSDRVSRTTQNIERSNIPVESSRTRQRQEISVPATSNTVRGMEHVSRTVMSNPRSKTNEGRTSSGMGAERMSRTTTPRESARPSVNTRKERTGTESNQRTGRGSVSVTRPGRG